MTRTILYALGSLLRTQDNAITAEPIFVVQQRHRIYGLDSDYAEAHVWLTDDGDADEATPEQAAKLDAFGMDRKGWRRVGVRDTWEWVQPFFTRVGAETYIEANAHNLTDPRVYVASGHRNDEWKLLRRVLMQEGGGA